MRLECMPTVHSAVHATHCAQLLQPQRMCGTLKRILMLQEEVVRTTPVMLIAACVLVLGSVRFSGLARAALGPTARFYSSLGNQHNTRCSIGLQHAYTVASALADFVDVALMLLALLLLLRYNYVMLLGLKLNSDPLVSSNNLE
jgi:hypothetical protein